MLVVFWYLPHNLVADNLIVIFNDIFDEAASANIITKVGLNFLVFICKV